MRKTILTFAVAMLAICANAAVATPEHGDEVLSPQDLKAENVYGTWTDPVGIAAYATEEQLEAAGGKATTDEISEGMGRMMETMGGGNDFVLVLTADGIMEANLMGRIVGGSYSVAGSTITFTAEGHTLSMEANVDEKEKKLKLFYPVSAIPEQMSQFFTRYNTDGLYLGVELNGK